MGTVISGAVRGANTLNYGDGAGDAQVVVNNRGDQSVVQGLAPMAESVRLGNTWQVSIVTGSAFTHVAAWPTTRAELLLYNGEPSNGKSYVIERVWAANVATSIAAASAYTIVGQIVPSGTAPTDNTSQLITSRSGKSTYGGRALKAIANTSYGVASKWEVLGTSVTPAASIGSATVADVNGGMIVPPGGFLLVNVVAGTAVGTGSMGIVWTETQLTLG